MTAASPDSERRLLPRWRASGDALLAGEVRSPISTRAKRSPVNTELEVAQLLECWQRERSVESAVELVSAAVVLSAEGDIGSAAELLAHPDSDTSVSMREVAQRFLAGKSGTPVAPDPLGFGPDEPRLRLAIGAAKRSLRQYPRNAVVWTDLARLYVVLGQRKKALDAVNVAISLAPENRFVLRSATRCLIHTGEELQRGLQALRSSRSLRTDPWLMAAEISLAGVAAEAPRSIQWARSMSADDALDPWDSSELNGALGTFALQNGGMGKPSKLFTKSLRNPTENAVAQAAWAAAEHKAAFVPRQLLLNPNMFEASAIHHRAQRSWPTVLDACRSWSALEPTSSRPLALGSFVALAALEDGAAALSFVERALLTTPNDPVIWNNKAVALAYLGRLPEARQAHHASNLRVPPRVRLSEPVYLATEGLLAYREGDREAGIQRYLAATKVRACNVNPALRLLVVWHWLREEARCDLAGVDLLVEKIWNASKGLHIPEFASMRDGILRQLQSRIGKAGSPPRGGGQLVDLLQHVDG